MRSVVVYESIYGNTHAIATAIGKGLEGAGPVEVLAAERAGRQELDGVDLVVVGGPTHGHGMSRVSTRKSGVDAARKAASRGAPMELVLDSDAEGLGLREWFASLGHLKARAAAFDTRFAGPAWLTGRASGGISQRLGRHGCTLVAAPESFFVTKGNQLRPGEEARAQAWGESLAATIGFKQESEGVRPGGDLR